jgi:hypothetical protein
MIVRVPLDPVALEQAGLYPDEIATVQHLESLPRTWEQDELDWMQQIMRRLRGGN